MKSKSNSIDLGYVHMSSYKPGDKLDKYAEKSGRVSPDPKEVVLKQGRYELEITYPLSNPFNAEFDVGAEGLTREGLIEKVIASYNHIYAAEEGDVGRKTSHIPGMLNRASSNGRYGIWGHDMGDLMLHTAYLTGNKIEISCDS